MLLFICVETLIRNVSILEQKQSEMCKYDLRNYIAINVLCKKDLQVQTSLSSLNMQIFEKIKKNENANGNTKQAIEHFQF